MKLNVTNHSRDLFKTRYIYPVVSRRAGGLSLGINLNTNNACNWQCIYCEVPNLKRGKPEPINLDQLKSELRDWLNEILNKDFLKKNTILGTEFKDIALSGNGEPTACKEFDLVLKIIREQLTSFNCKNDLKIRLITNGSHLHESNINKSWKELSLSKEIWFKIDSVNAQKVKIFNQVNLNLKQLKKNLESALAISPTIIQTCITRINNKLPEDQEIKSYIDFLKPYQNTILGIHLYSLARPSEQNTSLVLERVGEKELSLIADKMESLSIPIFTFS